MYTNRRANKKEGPPGSKATLVGGLCESLEGRERGRHRNPYCNNAKILRGKGASRVEREGGK